MHREMSRAPGGFQPEFPQPCCLREREREREKERERERGLIGFYAFCPEVSARRNCSSVQRVGPPPTDDGRASREMCRRWACITSHTPLTTGCPVLVCSTPRARAERPRIPAECDGQNAARAAADPSQDTAAGKSPAPHGDEAHVQGPASRRLRPSPFLSRGEAALKAAFILRSRSAERRTRPRRRWWSRASPWPRSAAPASLKRESSRGALPSASLFPSAAKLRDVPLKLAVRILNLQITGHSGSSRLANQVPDVIGDGIICV